jgi:hypothetical protein
MKALNLVVLVVAKGCLTVVLQVCIRFVNPTDNHDVLCNVRYSVPSCRDLHSDCTRSDRSES